jgi:hypothetical protein
MNPDTYAVTLRVVHPSIEPDVITAAWACRPSAHGAQAMRVARRKARRSQVATSGGYAESFVGLFGDRNFGFVLPAPMVQRLGAIGLNLSLDIYPGAERNESNEPDLSVFPASSRRSLRYKRSASERNPSGVPQIGGKASDRRIGNV